MCWQRLFVMGFCASLLACGSSKDGKSGALPGEEEADAAGSATADAGGGGTTDAPAVTPDAPVASPDAPVPAPDAPVASADAPVPAPDASIPVPDAAVPPPDAGVPPPDASVPPPDATLPPDAQVTPGPPTGVTAGATVTRGAIVRWTAPASTGMGPISAYVITATCGGDQISGGADEDATSYLFSLPALPAGTQCTFSVHAVNGLGDGAESTSTAAVTLVDGPQPPTIASCGGQNRVFLTHSDTQAGVTSYRVYRATASGVSKLDGAKTTTSTLPYTDSGVSVATTYYYVVAAVNGAGVESLDSLEVSATPTDQFQDTLFVSSQASGLFITDCMSQVPAHASRVTRTIRGALLTGGHNSGPDNVYVDLGNQRLYVTTAGSSPGVLIWNDAGTIDGSPTPARVLMGSFTGFVQPRGIFVDTQHDRLYVADYGDASIRIWDNASTIDGNVAPAAVLKGDLTKLSNAGQIYVHASADTLWVANGYGAEVFGNASELTGKVNKEANRALTFPTANAYGVWLETSDNRLFVSAWNTNGTVYEVAGAASADGAQDPAATLTGVALDAARQVQIRSGTLYLFNNLSDELHIFDDANTLDGAVTPTRSIGIGTTAGVGFSVVP